MENEGHVCSDEEAELGGGGQVCFEVFKCVECVAWVSRVDFVC